VNEVFWDNDEKTIIRQVYDQKATITDYQQAVDKTNALLDSVDYAVDLIMQVISISVDTQSLLSSVARTNQIRRNNIKRIILVTQISLLINLTRIAVRLFPNIAVTHFVPTLEEAYAILQETNQQS
jgi:hypothetical protein